VRVLCDENVPLAVERALAGGGHDVVAVRDRWPGATDRVVLQEALRERRLLITYDRDFGALLFHDRIRPAPLVLYVRTSLSASSDARRILQALEHVEAGFILVIDGNALRKRRLEDDVPER
jgi:predicted nuclease of predicted toxin-antitoxin system